MKKGNVVWCSAGATYSAVKLLMLVKSSKVYRFMAVFDESSLYKHNQADRHLNGV